MSSLMRIAAIAFALLTVGTSGIAAHDETSAPSILPTIGLPELHITVTNDGYEVPAEVPAGLTYVTLENHSDGFAEAQFAMLPEDLTIEGLVAGFQENTVPESFYRVVWAGGPTAAPDTIGAAVVDLAPGEWVISNSDGETPMEPVAITATGEAEFAEAGAVESDIQVTTGAYKFDFPDELQAGPQVWEVTNTDPVPHHIVLLYYPGAITAEDVMNLFAMEMGTPVPAPAINPDDLVDAGYVTIHAQNKTSWVEMNLQPGSYVALCFVSDPGTPIPHAAMGMVDVFTVPGEVATPEA